MEEKNEKRKGREEKRRGKEGGKEMEREGPAPEIFWPRSATDGVASTDGTGRFACETGLESQNCADYLPTAREQSVTDRLRSANKLPRILAKTNRSRTLLFAIL